MTAPDPTADALSLRSRGRARLVLALAAACAVVIGSGEARAEAYLRVIAQRAPVHTGPGADYRQVYYAARGDVFEVLERATTGYWFRVELQDGTTGWIYGELVFPFEAEPAQSSGALARAWRATRGALLGPSPVPRADVEISFSAGVLDLEGLYLLRPAWLIDEHWAVEAFAGLSPRGQVDLFLGGVGWTLRMVPGATLGPYVHAGVGVSHLRPKADNFIDEEQTQMAVVAGGGLELTFKKQITVRADFRNWTLFDTEQAANGQEYTGGLAIFF